MWFTTQDGLNRWDGHEFKVYNHQPFDSTTLSSSWLSDLAEDGDGNLWIGTAKGGLNKMDALKQEFVHFRHDPGDSTSIADDNVTGILFVCVFHDHRSCNLTKKHTWSDSNVFGNLCD